MPGVKMRWWRTYWIVIFIFPVFLLAQQASRVELIHADVSRGEERDGVLVRILEGNVHIRQDTIDIFCDRATYDPRQKIITLEGHLRINRGNERLEAQKILYYEQIRKAVAQNNVILRRPGQEMFTDYLEYFYETDQAFARGHLLLHDLEQRTFVRAHQGEYLPQKNLAYVQQKAHLWQVDSSGTDTLHIFAHKMVYIFAPNRQAIARDSVVIRRGDFIARCDSAIYLPDQERAFLEVHPVAQQKGNHLQGRRIEVLFQNMKVHRIIIHQQAWVTSLVDSVHGWQNRLDGDKIEMQFQNGELQLLTAISQAQSVYYIEDKQGRMGVNTATADTIRVFFHKGEVDSIAVIGGAQGVYSPQADASSKGK